MKAILLGDAMIGGAGFQRAWEKHMGRYGSDLVVNDWEKDWGQLQYRRLEVEKRGPEIETVDETILKEGQGRPGAHGAVRARVQQGDGRHAEAQDCGRFQSGTRKRQCGGGYQARYSGVQRAGRNAHAVSDFAVGMMLVECRNIARAHFAIRNGEWRKTFTNSDVVPELHGRTVGLVGFGHIGRLVAKKLSGFDVKVVVYDPYTPKEAIKELGAEKVELEELLKNSDFVSVHARLTSENKGMIGEHEIGLMKSTAYFINTGRAGLVDQDALAKALGDKKIMGAALDVFYTEPLPADSPFMTLDNVTLTTHIAGTTADALSNSPFLLMEDVAKFLKEGDSRFIVNRQVLQDEGFKAWLASVRQ